MQIRFQNSRSKDVSPRVTSFPLIYMKSSSTNLLNIGGRLVKVFKSHGGLFAGALSEKKASGTTC